MLAALVATSTIAIVAAVFAIWPVVADAPWEDDTVVAEDGDNAIRCGAALELRGAAMQTLREEPRNSFSYQEADSQHDFAQREIDRYCRDRCDVFLDALGSASSMDAILNIHDEMREAGC